MIIHTSHGPVEGTTTRHGSVFKGIPYAAASLRFQPPQPAEVWTHVRSATEYGPAAPQPHDPLLERMFGNAPFPTDEGSCLTLNIWTPKAADTGRPVMVWLHGGAFLTGSGRDPVFDGSRLSALNDIVVITLNYRLGALGFLHLGDLLGEEYADSGNIGLLDQIAALRWIRDNVTSFGGDPGNVTIFGQSAGAMSVLTLIAMPAAAGLFHKAIAQSSSAEYVHTPGDATTVAQEVLAALSLPDHAAQALLDIPIEMLLRAQQAVGESMRARGDGLGLPFAPVVDGVTLPEVPFDAIKEGTAVVPLILGTTLEEGRLFLAGPDAPFVDEETVSALFGAAFDNPGEAMSVLRKVQPDPSPLGMIAALTGERMFRAPTARLAEALSTRNKNVWTYLFAWRSTAHDGRLGSCHSLDLPFVFDNLGSPGVTRFTGDHPPQSLADTMSSAWAAFARHGHPGATWPAFDLTHRRTMIFDASSSVIEDPLPGLRSMRPAAPR